MDHNKELLRKIAQLESQNDHLVTELDYIDDILRKVGFEHGLATVKAVVEDVVLQKN